MASSVSRSLLSNPGDDRTLIQWSKDWLGSWVTMGAHLYTSNPKVDLPNRWNPKSDGLFVLVPGLGGDRSWVHHVSVLREHPQFDIYAPHVVKNGRCRLKASVDPIFIQVAEYAKSHPGKPIVLIGVSNGSRIVVSLDIRLRKHCPETAVRVSTIAGIHLGARGARFLGFLKVPQCLQRIGWAKKFPHVLCDELKPESRTVQRLVRQVTAH